MPEPSKAYYVTTPIYYVNDAPHIGHAYTTVAGDVLTRWHRQRGERRLVPHRHRRARPEGPAQRRGERRRPRRSGPTSWSRRPGSRCWTTIDVANDDFIRTTEPRHTERVQEFWQAPVRRGRVYKGAYEGPYCVRLRGVQAPRRAASTARTARRTAAARSTAGRSRRLSRDELLLPALGVRRRAARATTTRTPTSCSRRARATRSLSFVKQGLQDLSISPVDVRLGHPGPVGRRRTSSTCGSTRCSTTSPRSGSATPTRRSGSPRPGRPTSTWSARTSCGSTP